MGPSPARDTKTGDAKREDMLRLMLSLESLVSIGSVKEDATDEVAEEWEERFVVWQAQLKDLSRILNQTTNQLETEIKRADAAEAALKVFIMYLLIQINSNFIIADGRCQRCQDSARIWARCGTTQNCSFVAAWPVRTQDTTHDKRKVQAGLF